MSVLVRGMKMPNHCGECGIEWCERWKTLIVAGMPSAKARPSDCPLVPVPPHGRLIDADAFEEPFVEQIKSYDEWISKMLDAEDYGATNLILKAERDRAILATLVTKMKDTPTVIEAEERRWAE